MPRDEVIKTYAGRFPKNVEWVHLYDPEVEIAFWAELYRPRRGTTGTGRRSLLTDELCGGSGSRFTVISKALEEDRLRDHLSQVVNLRSGGLGLLRTGPVVVDPPSVPLCAVERPSTDRACLAHVCLVRRPWRRGRRQRRGWQRHAVSPAQGTDALAPGPIPIPCRSLSHADDRRHPAIRQPPTTDLYGTRHPPSDHLHATGRIHPTAPPTSGPRDCMLAADP